MVDGFGGFYIMGFCLYVQCLATYITLGIKKIWQLVKILLVLIIFYKMNTDKWCFTQMLISLNGLITKQIQSCNLHEDGRFFQLWTCFVIKWLSEIKIWVKHHYQYSFCKKYAAPILIFFWYLIKYKYPI